MQLIGLKTSGFRNLGHLDVEFFQGTNAVLGGNGMGKTNLLEAIYYLEIFRSFRGARDSEERWTRPDPG